MKKRVRLSIRTKIKARFHSNKLKIRQIKRRINAHRQRYVETMIQMFRDADEDGRQKLEALFFRTAGQSLAKLHEKRVIESLKKNTSSQT